MKKTIISLILLMAVLTLNVCAMDISYIDNSDYEDRVANYAFSNGLARVWRLGESAIVNYMGEVIIDYSSAEKAITPNGLIALLGENEKIGFFNAKGEQVTDFIYDAFVDVHEKTGARNVGYINNMHLRWGDGKSDLLAVSLGGKFGYINSYGNVIIPFKYEYAYGFSGGIARVCADGILSDYGTYTNGKYGFIKENGTEILPPDAYWVAEDFDPSLGYATATNGGSDTFFIDKWGGVAKYGSKELKSLDFKYVMITPKEPSIGIYYGIEDTSGNTIIPLQWTERIIVKGDIFVVNNTLRNNRNEIIYQAPENVRIHDLGDGLLRTTLFVGGSILGTGCIDVNGNVIFDTVYDSLRLLGDGLILAEKQGESFVYDYQGRLLWQMAEKPVAAYDGFIAVNTPDSLMSKIMVNQVKRPLVYLDGEKVAFSDAYPFIESDRTMVPLRAVFEKAGAVVDWNDAERLVTVSMEGLSASMNIGNKIITVNGESYETDVAPVIVNDRTYIPLRAFSEGLDMAVHWDEANYTVNLDAK